MATLALELSRLRPDIPTRSVPTSSHKLLPASATILPVLEPTGICCSDGISAEGMTVDPSRKPKVCDVTSVDTVALS